MTSHARRAEELCEAEGAGEDVRAHGERDRQGHGRAAQTAAETEERRGTGTTPPPPPHPAWPCPTSTAPLWHTCTSQGYTVLFVLTIFMIPNSFCIHL